MAEGGKHFAFCQGNVTLSDHSRNFFAHFASIFHASTGVSLQCWHKDLLYNYHSELACQNSGFLI